MFAVLGQENRESILTWSSVATVSEGRSDKSPALATSSRKTTLSKTRVTTLGASFGVLLPTPYGMLSREKCELYMLRVGTQHELRLEFSRVQSVCCSGQYESRMTAEKYTTYNIQKRNRKVEVYGKAQCGDSSPIDVNADISPLAPQGEPGKKPVAKRAPLP